ncbi:F-box protein SKIP14 [Argentina anserina]|uniref:F-box protein SKIP14 n=1 Tax=Argentina anserina TaxID=57926 RepID=UPI00217643C4|nr:F-box protein SKIP14 [Potentilla anserina]
MALNFSHRPFLVSPMRIRNGYLAEGISERPWHSNLDEGSSQEPVSNDIIDLLPSDPFGMDISTTFTAITGWLEDLEVDYGCYGRGDEAGTSNGNYELFAGLNFIWNNAMRFQTFPGSVGVDCGSKVASGFRGKQVGGGGASLKEKHVCGVSSSHGLVDKQGGNAASLGDGCLVGCSEENGSGDEFCNGGYDGCSKEEENADAPDALSCQGDIGSASAVARDPQPVDGICSFGDGGAHDGALMLALSYLGVRDLLVVESVCRSLYSTVRGDPLMWRTIHIDQPLNEKITDEVLLHLTNRAQGNLQCLSLVECPRITDDGLKSVLQNNPRLSKLSVPGCTRLSIEGIVNNLKAFKSKGAIGVKHLRIGGLYGVTQKHFDELRSLLGTDCQVQQNARKPHFYHRGNFYLSCDDDSDIDIEMCPRCQNLRLVYDCPAEACQGKEHPTQLCRACTLCIGRCAQCGRCINDSEYEETFCLELLCSDCWKQLLKSQEREDTEFVPSNSTVLHEQNHSFSPLG